MVGIILNQDIGNKTEVYTFHDSTEAIKWVNDLEDSTENFLHALISEMPYPLTIVFESDYVEKVFRDTYYTYFSRKFVSLPRNCQRLAFFKGEYKYEDFLNADESSHYLMQKSILGTITIKPTRITGSNCSMGRCLLNPYRFEKLEKYYFRTTSFKVSVLGTEYMIEAFPSSGQDGEMMSCSETCLWEIMEYYGSRYGYYRTVLPSEIISSLDRIVKERVLPSQGLTYEEITNLLKEFGFEPKVYSREAYLETEFNHELTWEEMFHASEDKISKYRKLFHCYVESAVPTIAGIRGLRGEGHSVVCIGHGSVAYERNVDNLQYTERNGFKFLESYQFVDEYVFVDDNRPFYTLERFDEYNDENVAMEEDGIVSDSPTDSDNHRRKIVFFSAPLYKHVYMEAEGADLIFDGFLDLLEDYLPELFQWCNGRYVIKRVYLATSNNYKHYHIVTAKALDEKYYYSRSGYPKMIWVCELADYQRWRSRDKNCVIGQIVLDATASNAEKFNGILEVRFGRHIARSLKKAPLSDIFEQLQQEQDGWCDILPYYYNNLKKGG